MRRCAASASTLARMDATGALMSNSTRTRSAPSDPAASGGAGVVGRRDQTRAEPVGGEDVGLE